MARDVLPDPETPTMATVRHSGTSTSRSRRLLCRAPRTSIAVGSVPGTGSPGPPPAAGVRPAPSIECAPRRAHLSIVTVTG